MAGRNPDYIPPLHKALIPVFILIFLLAFNVILIYQDSSTDGSNQLILMFCAAVAALIGVSEGFSWEQIESGIIQNISSTMQAVIILLLIGALAGAWMLSGIVPAMIYYGLKFINPTYFLAATCFICTLVSVSTGSSWSTTATVGIALFGVGKALGYHEALVAGTVISGAYFGDKISPLSETTNMAAAMAEVPLFNHVKYMLWTTIPSITISLLIYFIIGFNYNADTNLQEVQEVITSIENTFNITPLLFLVPIIVIALITKKMPAIPALLIGTFLGALFALIFQKNILLQMADPSLPRYEAFYKIIVDAMTIQTQIPAENSLLKTLLSSSGMSGMLSTVWLIIAAMMFGGVMDACNFLKSITVHILKLAKKPSSLISATILSCISTNVLASEQYLSILLPGRMYKDAYKKMGLAGENLSRSLEDGGTVTSALVPWNTCGAYQSSVLGVATAAYAPYAFFNIISPFMSIIFAIFKIKIKKLATKD